MSKFYQTKSLETEELILRSNLQILDLKQMADMEDYYKKKTRQAIDTYKNWQKLHGRQKDMIEILYGTMEGTMLRHQAEDTTRIYWRVRTDLRKALSVYIQTCCRRNYSNAA